MFIITRIIFMFLVALSILCASCASSIQEIKESDTQSLKEKWMNTNSLNIRLSIINEFERRKDVDATIACLALATHNLYGKNKKEKDIISIIQTLGNLKDPKSINDIKKATTNRSKKIIIAALKAFKKINSQEAVYPTIALMNTVDNDVRWEALDALSQFKNPASLDAIFPLLFDTDPNVRWKAIHTLGEVGDERAIGKISMLLADEEENVQKSAANVLIKLGSSEQEVESWRNKAQKISIEEIYQSQLNYHRTVTEKEILNKKLENESDIKRQLEVSLQEYERASKKHDELLGSLYEKERQLKSKTSQLELAMAQSKEYRTQLEVLSRQIDQINIDMKNAKNDSFAIEAKDELNKVIQSKENVEEESKALQEREIKLQKEILELSNIAEKTRNETDGAKKEIAELKNRENQLLNQVDELKRRIERGMAPVIVISRPQNGTSTESATTMLYFAAVDDKGIKSIDIFINNNKIIGESERGIKIAGRAKDYGSKKINISERIELNYGSNNIKVRVIDTDGLLNEEIIEINRIKYRGKIWAIVIGINEYKNTRNLRYAVNDAQAFKNYLKDFVGIPDENISLLINEYANKLAISSLLGTELKRKAGKDDTVLIFYAGHGAVETDPANPDGDGFEKYLLPHDADLNDLFSTALSMDDIETIFQRIRSERVIFIADTCYSGASGGRTILASKSRANLSEKFFERISKGKGRIIISSSSANEISKEDDQLGHGIFSFYLLEGLKGKADFDGDGIITATELFSFISKTVPEASGQDQHPVKKGEIEGELVVGRIK
ncbi:MAG: HEAT repeat domain-containing protein [Nitrospinales bacterium]